MSPMISNGILARLISQFTHLEDCDFMAHGTSPLSAPILREDVRTLTLTLPKFQKEAPHQTEASKITFLFGRFSGQPLEVWKRVWHLGAEASDDATHESQQHGPERPHLRILSSR